MKQKITAAILLNFLFCSLNALAQTKLALNWKPEPQFGGFYAALNNNEFKKRNLNVEILQGGSGTPTIQMLIAGQVDYAIVSADELILSHARGAKDVIALFATYQVNPQAIMTHKAAGFKTLQEVLNSEGVILWQSGLPYAQYLTKKFKPIKRKTAPYVGGIGNFLNDPKIAQQCFSTSEPLAVRKKNQDVDVFLVAESGFNPYTTVLVARTSFVNSQKEEVKKMVEATRAGWLDYLKDPQKTNKLMGELNKAMDMETFKDSAEAQKFLVQPAGLPEENLGKMSKDRWSSLVDQMHSLGLIRKKVATEGLFLDL